MTAKPADGSNVVFSQGVRVDLLTAELGAVGLFFGSVLRRREPTEVTGVDACVMALPATMGCFMLRRWRWAVRCFANETVG